MSSTETQNVTATKLRKIALISSGDPKKQFLSLMHHYNLASLKECFQELKRNKSPGIDGLTKEDYESNLDERLQNLLTRMKKMSYKPAPVRQVFIPKEGSRTEKRPLGINNVEDKIVMKMTQKILESIYEPLFLNGSYGFRKGRGCHDAIKDLREHLFKEKVQVVLDIDIKNFFGSIDHKILVEMIREKIKDTRFIRYIVRTLKAGILTGAELTVSDEGVVQGSPCSPVLANVFAHYVIDKWFEEIVKPRCKGKVALYRYSDDCVICCDEASDAPRILKALENRLKKFSLQLNLEKTKTVQFSKEGFHKGDKQQTFDFLGFTFYLAPTQNGIVTAKVKSAGKRMRAKLKKVKYWCKETVNRLPLHEIWKKFCIKMTGHIRYYGVTYNSKYVNKFLYKAIRILFRWLNRRSQKKSYTWEQFGMFIRQFPPPKVKIYHPLF